MNKIFFIKFLLFAGLLGALAPHGYTETGYTETIKGEIKGVSPEGRSFKLVRLDTRDELRIWLSVETKFQGLSSLHELAVGDEVTVEAQKDSPNGHWESDSLTVDKIVVRNTKSDVETLQESQGNSAVAATLEVESRRRVQHELRKTLDQLDKEIELLPADKDLRSIQLEAKTNLKVLERAASETWEQARLNTEKIFEKLRTILETQKQKK